MQARATRIALRSAGLVFAVVIWFMTTTARAGAPDAAGVIARIKPSIVAVGTFERARSPSFQFRGTGFAVGDGNTVATNAHVLPGRVDAARLESVAVLMPGPQANTAQVRVGRPAKIDVEHDLALIRIDGTPIPVLTLGDSNDVREGQDVLITGFPIGAVLGPIPVSHRGMVSAITPIAIPQRSASDLRSAVVVRLSQGPFTVFQLDATVYPGSSGSPVYDPTSGEVLGIVNMTFVKGSKEAALEKPSGISYAIPASHLKALLQTLP